MAHNKSYLPRSSFLDELLWPTCGWMLLTHVDAIVGLTIQNSNELKIMKVDKVVRISIEGDGQLQIVLLDIFLQNSIPIIALL